MLEVHAVIIAYVLIYIIATIEIKQKKDKDGN